MLARRTTVDSERCVLTTGHIVAIHRVPRGHSHSRAREPIVEAPARDLAALATIALLFAAVVQVMLIARHRREVEARLDEAHAELDTMRERLAEATRPPAQFARMHLRETAVYRFARLRRAVPHRQHLTQMSESVRD
jgi:hypothetical protein